MLLLPTQEMYPITEQVAEESLRGGRASAVPDEVEESHVIDVDLVDTPSQDTP